MQGSAGEAARLQVLNAVQNSLSDAAQDCLEALASSAQALSLRDVSSGAMLLAALEAVSAAQAVEDEEARAYDLIKQLEAQAAVVAQLLEGLSATLGEVEQASVTAGVEAETHRLKAPEELAKVDRYRAQQAQHAARLAALGYDDTLSHGHLRSLGHKHGQLTAELKAAETGTQRFAGLPADMAAAKAVHLEKLQELERLKARLAAGLAGL
ncbi:hypothetical protein N2152v2_000462 [Parachlorella kessleri]